MPSPTPSAPGPDTAAPPGAAPPAPLAAAPRRHRTRLLELSEVRWAAAALAVFLTALPLDLLGGPALLTGLLYAAVYALGGWEPALAGLKALKERTLDVDLLMVVAALGAAAVGEPGDGALLIVIFAVSGALEAVATARTEDSVRGLLDLAPATATRLRPVGGEEVEESVAAEDLAVGDTVLVRPGEAVGADGRVVDGRSEVDQATITGEPLPADKAPGDDVYAGTLNGSGALTVRVRRESGDAVVARIAAMVEEASRTTSPTQRFIERIEQRYSVGMVAATIAIFTVPLAFGADAASALLRAMTFMIVASPCAVVLSTMPPLLAAIANAGRHGVLVKSAEALERLAAADAVALDKTGTLTEGAPRVADVRPLDGGDRASLLALAAAAERPSEHPIARAVVAAAREERAEIAQARDFSSAPGEGVRAAVGGERIAVGSPARLLDARADDGDGPVAGAREEARALEERGRTAVVVLRDGRPAGVLGVADRMREGAAEAVAALGARTGRPPVLLTGDAPAAARRTAEEAGVTDVEAGLLPEDKVARVRAMEESGARVMMVGDGVNDAPALAAAHTGVAMGRSGSDLSRRTADAVVVRDELNAVAAAASLARRARGLVVQNLVIAGVFITALVAWDLLGHLPMPLAVAGHEGSTVIVALNGLRLLGEGAWRKAAAD